MFLEIHYESQGQNLAFLLQLPAGLPKITISKAQQKVLGTKQVTLHMKYSTFQSPSRVLSEIFQGQRPILSGLRLHVHSPMGH